MSPEPPATKTPAIATPATEPRATVTPAAGPSAAAPDDPRWLDDEQQAAWRGYLAMVRHITTGTNRQLHEEAGLPHGYYQILAMLSESPDRTLRMSQLAEITMTSQSRMSHAIKALEARGWVRRRAVEDDRRGHAAVLTDAGFDVLVAAAPGHAAEVLRLMFDRLSRAQIRQLAEIARAVAPPG